MEKSECSVATRLALADALDIVPDAVIMLNENQRILFFNKGAERTFGYLSEEILGQPLDRLVPSRFIKMHHEHIHAFSATSEAARRMGDPLQVRGRRRDGSEFPAEANISKLVKDEQTTFTVIVRDITDRLGADETLRRWLHIFDHVEWGVVIGSADGRTLEMVNPAFARMHGYTVEELIGRPISDIFAPDARSELPHQIRLAHEKGHHTYESKHIRKDGTIFPVSVDVTAVKDEAGCVLHRVINVQDITERKRAEETRRESEERYRSMVSAIQEGIVFQDASGRISACNASAECILGLSRDQMMGRTSLDLRWRAIHEDHSPFPGDLHPAMVTLRTGQPQSNVIMGVHKPDGTLAWISINSRPLFCQGETAPYAVVTSFTDISERKQAQAALVESEERYRSIFESVNDGLIINAMDGHVVEANPAACRMHGYTYDEFLHLDPLSIIHPKDRHLFADFVGKVKAGETFEAQAVNIRKDGTEFYVEVRGTPFMVQGLPHVLGVVRDVTERMQAYQLLEQRVAERTRELSTLLEVSHNVASTLELGPLLRLILEQLKSVVNYTSAAIFTLEDEELVILEYQVPTLDRPAHPLRLPLEEAGLGQKVIQSREPIIVDDVQGDIPLARAVQRSGRADVKTIFSYAHSWMAVPLIAKDKVIGMLGLAYDEPGYYTSQHAKLVLTIANQAAVAMENARLYERARQLSALEERQRLARELHDSVSQALYSIALGARTARTWLDRNPAKAAEPLDYVRSLAEAGLAEMRALIFELRPESLESEGLAAALTKQADALHARHGVDVQVSLCDEPSMSMEVRETLYRIAQEALHNVVKHARASRVSLALSCHDDDIVLEVWDNGLGFDTTGLFPGHLGLRSMRERAERVGGTFQVSSSPGGTCIQVRVKSRR